MLVKICHCKSEAIQHINSEESIIQFAHNLWCQEIFEEVHYLELHELCVNMVIGNTHIQESVKLKSCLKHHVCQKIKRNKEDLKVCYIWLPFSHLRHCWSKRKSCPLSERCLDRIDAGQVDLALGLNSQYTPDDMNTERQNELEVIRKPTTLILFMICSIKVLDLQLAVRGLVTEIIEAACISYHS